MGFFCAILAIVVYAVLGVTYKLSEKLKCDPGHANFFMFISASAVVLIWGLITRQLGFVWRAAGLGSVMALTCFGSVVVFRRAAGLGRISTSWTVLNLALVLPVMASILIWKEAPHPKHWIGLGLTAVAIVLLGIDMGRAGE